MLILLFNRWSSNRSDSPKNRTETGRHPLVFTSDTYCRKWNLYWPFKLLPTFVNSTGKNRTSIFHQVQTYISHHEPLGRLSNRELFKKRFGTSSCQDAWQRTTVDLGLLVERWSPRMMEPIAMLREFLTLAASLLEAQDPQFWWGTPSFKVHLPIFLWLNSISEKNSFHGFDVWTLQFWPSPPSLVPCWLWARRASPVRCSGCAFRQSKQVHLALYTYIYIHITLW